MRQLAWILLGAGAAACAAPANTIGTAPTPQLQRLDVSAGRWVFHGKLAPTKSAKPGAFTWNENCRWSPNHLYLECTFSNLWSGKAVESLVVDTYNSADHGYWHYELFATGEPGRKPFISRMTIAGNTWIEYGGRAVPGKKSGERIVYHWGPPGRVRVAIERSKDGVHWTATAKGDGHRIRVGRR
ncbi:MAG TPA: hypothetical protein VND80_09895 [Steroidobacteraceae bacterium]|nr:hypothetical protein [Steroidobacteraceae bacterium]